VGTGVITDQRMISIHDRLGDVDVTSDRVIAKQFCRAHPQGIVLTCAYSANAAAFVRNEAGEGMCPPSSAQIKESCPLKACKLCEWRKRLAAVGAPYGFKSIKNPFAHSQRDSFEHDQIIC
jgi:hypothetical protein